MDVVGKKLVRMCVPQRATNKFKNIKQPFKHIYSVTRNTVFKGFLVAH